MRSQGRGRRGGSGGEPGTAQPLEAFIDDAQKLAPDLFEKRHGTGFLLLTATRLEFRGESQATDVKLFDEDASARTAGVAVLVYPIRPAQESPVHLLTVGRGDNNDVVVRDISVSRFHAFLRRDEGGSFLLQDAGSTNGTTVNGDSVPARDAGSPVALKPGDDVRIGRVDFTFVDAPALRSFVLKAAG